MAVSEFINPGCGNPEFVDPNCIQPKPENYIPKFKETQIVVFVGSTFRISGSCVPDPYYSTTTYGTPSCSTLCPAHDGKGKEEEYAE